MNDTVSPCQTKDDYGICRVCEAEVQKLPVAPITLADETTTSVSEPPSIRKVIDEQSMVDFSRKATVPVRTPASQ